MQPPVTLARLHRTMTAGDAGKSDTAEWDFEAEPNPIFDSRLIMGMPAKRLADVSQEDFRVVWYGEKMQAEVFVKGKWQPLREG